GHPVGKVTRSRARAASLHTVPGVRTDHSGNRTSEDVTPVGAAAEGLLPFSGRAARSAGGRSGDGEHVRLGREDHLGATAQEVAVDLEGGRGLGGDPHRRHVVGADQTRTAGDRKSRRLNSSHVSTWY